MDMNCTGKEMVDYTNGNLTVSYTSAPKGLLNTDYYYDFHDCYYHHWYPATTYITEKSKVEQAFKIVGKMLENKIIVKELTIKEFIKLVNDIAELL